MVKKKIILFIIYLLILLFILLLSGCDYSSKAIVLEDDLVSWRFVVVGDTHVGFNSDTITEMIPNFIEDDIDLVLICGDIVNGGKRTTASELELELEMWQEIFEPLYKAGIGVYPVRGNHENDVLNNISVWNKMFSGTKSLPQNGPSGEINLTYSFNHKNAFFIGLDTYVNIHRINQNWIDQELNANLKPHVFVFAHESAFKVFHSDCLDDFLLERDTFWKSLTNAGVKTFFCGHDHFFDLIQIDDGDNNSENDIYQCIVGGGGGSLMSKYRYNGDNSSYQIKTKYHRIEYGYILVEISGETFRDVDVILTWKERTVEENKIKYISTPYKIEYRRYL